MSTRFLNQYVLPSDNHAFVGRIYDLSIVGMHFETYEDLAKHADCKYAFHINNALSMLTRRVESLNMVGGMLWPTNIPKNFEKFPVSRYEWLNRIGRRLPCPLHIRGRLRDHPRQRSPGMGAVD